MKTGDDTGVIPRMPGDAEKGGRVLVFPPADGAWPWYLYIVASCALAGLYFAHIAVHPFDKDDADYVATAALMGISQQVRLKAIPTGEHRIYKIETHIERLSGDMVSWQRMNRNFLTVLRKRFLVWRTLPAGIREEYQTRVNEEYGVEMA